MADNYMDLLKKSILDLEQPESPEIPVTQEDVTNAELAQINEEAKSPYQQTKPELIKNEMQKEAQTMPMGQAIQDREPASQTDPMLAKYKSAIEAYEGKLNAPKKEYGVMDGLPDILAGLYNIGARAKGNVLPDMKMPNSIKNRKAEDSASRKEDLSGLQNLQGMYAKYMDMQRKGQPKQISELDKAKIAKLKKETADTTKAPTFEEKERKKAEIKDEIATKKENRKFRQETEKSVSKIDEQIQKVKAARDMIKKASKSKDFGDTGPLDQYTNKFTDRGQKIEQAINAVSLDTMTKMFEGMSKAIDSDAERAFFQASQPSVGKYPQANMDILDGMLKNLESLKSKNKRLVGEISRSGERKESAPQTNEVKRRTKDGRTAIFNADTKEFLRYE